MKQTWDYYDTDRGVDDDPPEHCFRCAGDGIVICDGGTDCPDADDAGCPFTDFHTYRCSDCGGTGNFR